MLSSLLSRSTLTPPLGVLHLSAEPSSTMPEKPEPTCARMSLLSYITEAYAHQSSSFTFQLLLTANYLTIYLENEFIDLRL